MIIYFEILQPEKFLPAIGVTITLDEILGINKVDLVQKSETEIDLNVVDPYKNNALKKLRFFLIIGGMGFAMMFVVFLVTLFFKKVREKFFSFAKNLIKSFMWNNTIQMVYVSYLPQGIIITAAFWNTLKTEGFKGTNFIANTAQVSFLLVFPLMMMIYLYCKKSQLRGNRQINSKFGMMYLEVRLPYPKHYKKD